MSLSPLSGASLVDTVDSNPGYERRFTGATVETTSRTVTNRPISTYLATVNSANEIDQS
jgi:hypothetical protein